MCNSLAPAPCSKGMRERWHALDLGYDKGMGKGGGSEVSPQNCIQMDGEESAAKTDGYSYRGPRSGSQHSTVHIHTSRPQKIFLNLEKNVLKSYIHTAKNLILSSPPSLPQTKSLQTLHNVSGTIFRASINFKGSVVLAGWWCTSLIPVLVRQRQACSVI